jgi:lipid-A-disaccharide synthase
VANSKTSKLYFVAGEASGDSRGAELMRALHEREPAMEFHGLGGPQMRAIAGGSFRDWTDRAGVIGIIDVLKNYGWFREQFDAALAEILATKPDALVLIDYPGFNLRLAKAVKAANPSQRIIYYISPQVWAWHRGRIPKMARTLDRSTKSPACAPSSSGTRWWTRSARSATAPRATKTWSRCCPAAASAR